jgi:hypothetical protein
MKTAGFSGVLALLTMAPSAFVAVDSTGNSAGHHIKSLAALRKEVVRWGEEYNPTLSERDVDAVVGWLNSNFYHFDD